MVGLVGVQSNQFPRARRYRPAVPRCRHPGRHGRLPCLRAASPCCRKCPPEIVEAQELGISIYAGEAEGRMDEVAAGGMGRHS